MLYSSCQGRWCPRIPARLPCPSLRPIPGRIVEIAGRDDLYANPQHPYTVSLFSAVPRPEPNRKADRIRLEGEVPSPITPPTAYFSVYFARLLLERQFPKDVALLKVDVPSDATPQTPGRLRASR
ncbi:MAG: hypothetical protein KKB85_03570, partial [Candidatus Altiarchaeota archaeon]|nr:hypothetical protein [Candidatus Altiarchaeota archaeon]